MDRGTYAAASAGLSKLRYLDVVSNNIANVNTPGYKKQIVTTNTRQFQDTLASTLREPDPYGRADHIRIPSATDIQTSIDFSPGPVEHTDNPFHVALRNSNDFFVVNSANGPVYTRAGDFNLDEEGRLVTSDGQPVSGDGGDIILDGTNARITPGGAVTVNGVVAGQIQVVRIENTESLKAEGSNGYRLTGGGAPQVVEADLITGALEMANVSVTGSMVEMITAQRGFELYTKVAQTIDKMNQTANTQIGKKR